MTSQTKPIAPASDDARLADALEDALIQLLWDTHHDPLQKLSELESQTLSLHSPSPAREKLAASFANIRRKLLRQIN